MAGKASYQGGQFVGVGWYFHALLVCSGVFLALRWNMFERILGVGAVRNWPGLAAKPSSSGRLMWTGHPALCAISLLKDVGLECEVLGSRGFFLALATKPFFGGVATPMGPHTMFVGLGPRPFGLTLLGQTTPWGRCQVQAILIQGGCVTS
jgi:hypothetical protein